jgi:RNA polymerase sigma-70 factor (ECF subfamily)
MTPITHKEEFVQLMQENKRIIFKICNSYCANKDDRDDLAQEIVYNLWKAFHSFDPDYKFSTWMYRIALNVAISFYRKENKFKSHVAFSENLIVFDDNKEESKEVEGNISLLQRFISELKEIDKSIMLLYLDDKTYKEIAEITGNHCNKRFHQDQSNKGNTKNKFLTKQNNYHGTK